MAQENVDAWLRVTEAIGRGDVEATLADVHPDAVFEPQRAATEGTFAGHEGMRRFLADTAETFEFFVPEYTDVRDLGDRVLAIGSIKVRGRGGGVETEVPTAMLAVMRDGLILRCKDYVEASLALEAARHADLIERSYDAFREDDLEALIALYHPDAVWDMTHWDGFPDATEFRGAAGIEEVHRMLLDVFGELEAAPVEIVEAGEDRAFVRGEMTVRGKSSGVPLQAPPFAQIVEFRNDLIARTENYSDLGAGLRAAGLP